MSLIDKEYTKHSFYGIGKIQDYLRKQGHKVNRKRMQLLCDKSEYNL
ncbi:IS3 family transposase [Desulfosediminicola flagellatus]